MYIQTTQKSEVGIEEQAIKAEGLGPCSSVLQFSYYRLFGRTLRPASRAVTVRLRVRLHRLLSTIVHFRPGTQVIRFLISIQIHSISSEASVPVLTGLASLGQVVNPYKTAGVRR